MINTTMDQQTFNALFPGGPVIVGCGSVGARIAIDIARLGIENINLYDFDRVEEKNTHNQPFLRGDIGEMKVSATKSLIHYISDCKIHEYPLRFGNNPESHPGPLVIIAVDTMRARQEILARCIERNVTKHLIDCRCGLSEAQVLAFDWTPENIETYKKTLFTDEEVNTTEETVSQRACERPSAVTSPIMASTLALQVLIDLAEKGGLAYKQLTVSLKLKGMFGIANN